VTGATATSTETTAGTTTGTTATLVARLTGPLQAWGAAPSLRTASTHPTPTWSGLLGLARAALGHGRHADPADIDWLRHLTMAVRVDAPGRVHTDFHTINPLPDSYSRFGGISDGTRARGQVPTGKDVSARGTVDRWEANETSTMITYRQLIHDAAFLWLAEGPAEHVDRLASALARPRWQLALGRRSCTPASPLLLGVHPATLADVAAAAPLDGHQPARRRTVDLVHLHTGPTGSAPAVDSGAGSARRSRTVLDVPLGSHPQHGYAAAQHTINPIAAPPTSDLLSWAASQLTHPARPDAGSTAEGAR